jgi:hypothetical protein
LSARANSSLVSPDFEEGHALQKKEQIMKLAHYTHIMPLPRIVQDGIAKGEVTITPIHVLNFPWFTSEFSQDAQEDWVRFTPSKRTLRLEVEFPEDDERLVRWRDYAKRLRLRADLYERMTGPNTGRNGRTWFVYRGVVPFDWVTNAYFHPCHERLTQADLRRAAEIFAPWALQSGPCLPCIHLTEDQALALSHDDRQAGHSKPVAAALRDVAAHRKGKLFGPSRAHSFFDYAQGIAIALQDARR